MTLDLTADELAGIIDIFDALTRSELETAIDELAFKHRDDPPDEPIIDESVASYHLVEYDDTSIVGDNTYSSEDNSLLVVGPTAFPTIPEKGTNLPHIMDVEPRQIDWQHLARTVEERFRIETARALADGDEKTVVHLLDVSYDLEAWGPVELASVRERLDSATEIE
jgi:hypothetical protein